MLKAEGYSIITAPGERPVEQDTFTCGHCNAISLTSPGFGKPLQVAVVRADGSVYMKDAGFCRNCFRHICPRCENFECVPLEKKLELEERAARRLILPCGT